MGGAPGMRVMYLALVTMLLQQVSTTFCKSIVPVITPAITADLGLTPGETGLFVNAFVFSQAFASTVVAGICGRWMQRWGAMRVSQAAMLVMAAGLGMCVAGGGLGAGALVALFAAAALVIGSGTVIATPASSEILARVTPRHLAPLVFSIKQTGVPAGITVAALLGPFLVHVANWQTALAVTGGIALLLAAMLQPVAVRIEKPGERREGTARATMFGTMLMIMRSPALREMAISQAVFVGLQNTFVALFVTFLTKAMDRPLAVAGVIFAIAQMVAMGARVFWGWVAGRFGDARRILGLLGIAMGFAALATGAIGPGWGDLAIYATAAAFSATAVSWHGVQFAEIARLSPPGEVGGITGGIIAFGSATSVLYPLMTSAVLATLGSYAWCFWLAGLPAFLMGLLLMRRRAT